MIRSPRLRLAALVIATSVNGAIAQTYPTYKNTTVNDYANLLPTADEATLSQQLRQLKSDTGVEMTVLTLDTRTDFAPNKTLEQFATGLFNNWGIGDKSRNNGVLVMILRSDRAMRIELGAAYGREWDKVAQRVVDHQFLPAFKNDNYARGILNGSTAVINDIVLPFNNGDAAPAPVGNASGWITLSIFTAVASLFAGRGAIGDGLARLRRCPKCGKRTLRQSRRTTMPATMKIQGSGIRNVTCSNCDYSAEFFYSISRLSSGSSRSSGGFGGGSSGGGGTSGRW